jgi:hypothetical protein
MCIYVSVKKVQADKLQDIGRIFCHSFMLIFDRAEKVNIIEQIPLSTVLIAIAMLTFMVKILVEGKVKLINHPFMLYFFYACAFLLILTVVSYPFFHYHYQMQPDSNIHLFSKMVKYAILFILVVNCLPDGKKFKKMNRGFILSLSVSVILSILL